MITHENTGHAFAVLIRLGQPETLTSTEAPITMDVNPRYLGPTPEATFDINTNKLILSHGSVILLDPAGTWGWHA